MLDHQSLIILTISIMCAYFKQVFCHLLLTMIGLQPDAVRRSHWARHWACAVNVLELLAAESAFTYSGGRLVAEGAGEVMMYETNITLKDNVVKLMGDQYRPGEHRAVRYANVTSTCTLNIHVISHTSKDS